MTVRCARTEFRLVPDTERTELFKFLLAKALERCPGVALHAVVQMSNHFHLVLTDADSELACMMKYFDGQLAKALNRVDRTRGQVFERRYAATEIVDDEALDDRIVYAVTNPVAAGLVESYRDWPGLVAWYGSDASIPCSRFRSRQHRRAFDMAMRRGEAPPDRELFTDRVDLVLVGDGGSERGGVRAAIEDRERLLARDRSGGVLGVEQVLLADPFDSPLSPKRSKMPLCHASTRERWFDYRDGWRAFVSAYREASAAFRRGVMRVRFPDFAFRPSLPLGVPIG